MEQISYANIKESDLSVGKLTDKIKLVLATNFRSISVYGEISDFKKGDHYNFTLKDQTTPAVIKVVQFSNFIKNNDKSFIPKDGDLVLIEGEVSFWSKNGQICLNAQKIIILGKGFLLQKIEELKCKLKSEGLFEESRKLKAPKPPSSIGLITSYRGAVYKEFDQILYRRYPKTKIYLFDSLVQGAEAVDSIIQGILYFHKNPVDIIVIARGGGSFEDLLPFSDEKLLRYVAERKIPIVSAIGHKEDHPLLDDIADLVAYTPSEAAEKLVPDRIELIKRIDIQLRRLNSSLDKKIMVLKDKWYSSVSRQVIQDPLRILTIKKDSLNKNYKIILINFNKKWDQIVQLWKSKQEKLNIANPLSILSRGYSITYKNDKANIIFSKDDVQLKEDIWTRISDGWIKSVSSEIEPIKEVNSLENKNE